MTSPQALTVDLGNEFPQQERLIYLNHAALSPWPRRTADAIRRFADENLYRGCLNYDLWLDAERRLRQRISRLINASQVDDIALQKNTSEAISAVALGLPWRSGDNVVLPGEEFPSNLWPWESLQARGVDVRLQQTGGLARPELAMIAACDERTRLISTSTVSFSSGARIDHAELGGFCRDQGILFCVDAIQSLGALPIDVRKDSIDCLACGAHKWLLAPEGLGFLYIRESLRSQLNLNQYGWRMTDKPFAFDQTKQATTASARRFESGTLNTLGIIGLDASLSLIEDIGVSSIADRVLDNSRFLIEGLKTIDGLEVVTPDESSRHAGIVSLKAGTDTATKRLNGDLKSNNILAAVRRGCLRLSPHFYTPRERLEMTLDQIAKSHATTACQQK
jgi:cysteine desulfurase/selenocysteine lyase